MNIGTDSRRWHAISLGDSRLGALPDNGQLAEMKMKKKVLSSTNLHTMSGVRQ